MLRGEKEKRKSKTKTLNPAASFKSRDNALFNIKKTTLIIINIIIYGYCQ
jgi:hypothetical protein